ncbi:MAG: Flp pilus assembly protein TadD [Pseudohongiellaceae bacterium]|jgi:Flp pilus assembly protein TadD
MTKSTLDSERQTDASRRLSWRLNRSALAFETSVLERLVAGHPANIDYLVALGQAYARLRRHQSGLEIDRTLVARQPEEPTFRYNLACSLALTGDLNGACGELLQAIALGYRDFEHLLADDDLVALRRDNRFGLIRDRMAELTSPQGN